MLASGSRRDAHASSELVSARPHLMYLAQVLGIRVLNTEYHVLPQHIIQHTGLLGVLGTTSTTLYSMLENGVFFENPISPHESNHQGHISPLTNKTNFVSDYEDVAIRATESHHGGNF